MSKIPIYEFLFDDPESELLGISIVDEPAIMQDFIKLKNQERVNFKIQSDDKQLLVGPAMIPGMMIYRVSKEYGEYYGYFTSDTIRKIVYKYFATDSVNKFNINHSDELIKGVIMVESWFKEGEKDKSYQYGYNLPDGTWMVSMHIQDPEIWSRVKKGELNGYSIEAICSLAEEALFSKFTSECPITDEDIIVTAFNKWVKEEQLKDGELDIGKSYRVYQWASDCKCHRCSELKGLGWNLEGVLPEGALKSKIIK